MFTQQTNKPIAQVIKTYLRLKDKKSFPVMLRLPIIISDLKDIVIKKTKIPEDDLIVMLQGKQIDFKNQLDPIELKDKSILHIINKKYLRNDILDLLVRMVLRNQEKSCLGQTKLVAKADQPIEQFIEKQLLPVIQQRTSQKLTSDCVNLVSNGNVLKKDLKFHNYLIQNGAEIICMINFIEELQRSVKNLSTHRLMSSHRQDKLYRSLTTQIPKEKLKISTDDKKTSQEKQPEKQVESKQHQTNKDEDEDKKIKLERKQNITPKYFESDGKEKFSPTLYPQFADLLNKDIPDGWQQKVPQSPVSVQYPKAQNKSQTKVQWDDEKTPQKTQLLSQEFKLQASEKPIKSQKSEKPLEISPEAQSQKLQKQKKQETKQKQEKVELKQEESKIKLGDFLIMGEMRKSSEKKTRQEFIEDMSQKLDTFLEKKYEESVFSQIAIEYPQLEKKISVKPGDLIICGDMFMNSSKFINQSLLQKFNELIQQKNKKIQQDYDLESRLNQEKSSSETMKTTQIPSV